VLVAATLGVFATGVALLLIGHRSRTVLELHKITFIVWGVFFVVHFLWHLPRAWRAASFHWRASRPDRRPGSTLRALAVAATIGGGFALALVLLAQIDAWQRGH
jgi:hypothetical protein